MNETTVLTVAEGARGAQRSGLKSSASLFVVQPRRDGRWEVIRPGAPRASAVVDTRSDAVDRAQDLARAGGVSAVHVRKAGAAEPDASGGPTAGLCDLTCGYCWGPETD